MRSKSFNVIFAECKVIASNEIFITRISLNDIISSSISDYREKLIDINKMNSLRTLIEFIEYISVSCHFSYIAGLKHFSSYS